MHDSVITTLATIYVVIGVHRIIVTVGEAGNYLVCIHVAAGSRPGLEYINWVALIYMMLQKDLLQICTYRNLLCACLSTLKSI